MKKVLKKRAAEGCVPVTAKFLNGLAKEIYNPSTRQYLRLCPGTLQNGPDPKNKARPMHCGLGELYFKMTGYQPEETGVTEDDVVKLATANSSAKLKLDDVVEGAKYALEQLPLGLETRKSEFISEIEDAAQWNEDDVHDTYCGEMAEDLVEFRRILDEIPGENDDVQDDDEDREFCTPATYKERSKRVAERLRDAAKLLPW